MSKPKWRRDLEWRGGCALEFPVLFRSGFYFYRIEANEIFSDFKKPSDYLNFKQEWGNINEQILAYALGYTDLSI